MSAWGNWKRLHPETTLYHAPAIALRDKIVAWMLQAMIPISKLSQRSRPWHRIRGELDSRLPAMSFVIGVEINDDSCGYPVEALRGSPVLNDAVGGKPITVFYDLEHELGQVFSRQVDSRILTFVPSSVQGTPAVARDKETGTTHPWELSEMASRAGMSRARFAVHFREVTGDTPADFLASWRITLAQGLLRAGRPLKHVAQEVGYGSASALTRAFVRKIGQPPSRWMRHDEEAAEAAIAG
jgi:AraC-like DNA-binding protein